MKKYSTQFYGGKNSRREKKKAWRSKLVQTQLDRKSCKHTNTFAIPMLHFLCFNTHIHTKKSVLKSSLRPFTRINSEKHLSIISSHCLISHTHTHTLFITHTELIAEPRGDKLECERCVRNPHLSPPELLT